MNFFQLEGRRAIVTGAARGIGLAIAERLARAGATVVIADVNLDHAKTKANHLTEVIGRPVLACQADVTRADEVQAMVDFTVEQAGGLDILVNNAGIAGKAEPIWETDEEEFRQVLDVDLVGVWLCCRAAVVPMRQQKYGRIINIASVAGKEGNPNMIAYSASKAGVIALTKSLAKEVVADGIIVNAITPAVICTPILDQLTPDQVHYMTARIPLGRMGKPEEVAALTHFLASEECSFSTGATFDISGGRTTY
jgi:3-oxoacyl-[acyl-carrier protein] reductase